MSLDPNSVLNTYKIASRQAGDDVELLRTAQLAAVQGLTQMLQVETRVLVNDLEQMTVALCLDKGPKEFTDLAERQATPHREKLKNILEAIEVFAKDMGNAPLAQQSQAAQSNLGGSQVIVFLQQLFMGLLNALKQLIGSKQESGVHLPEAEESALIEAIVDRGNVGNIAQQDRGTSEMVIAYADNVARAVAKAVAPDVITVLSGAEADQQAAAETKRATSHSR